MRFKRTKIVATIGPSSSEPERLAELIRAGMNVARLNFSHGSHEDHARSIKTVRAVSEKLGEPIAIMQDLSGPKVRIGDFADGSITLVPGARFTLSTLPCAGSTERVFINYPHLHEEVRKGAIIMLDDGRRKLEVVSVRGNEVITTVLVGGTIKGRRGVNIPGAFREISPITRKDREDLVFGLAQRVDFVALSFVRTADDIKKLRTLIKKHSPKHTPAIIAKIETLEAIENIDAIIAETDGIMVARGDLAVEVSPENVPLLQKSIISKSVAAGKPVITATQMLESMIQSPVPTRAEVGDVANAILDGTDAVMLSQETAMGDYPVEAVAMMAKIADKTENDRSYRDLFRDTRAHEETETVDAIGRAVVDVAHATNAKAIVALSESGFTARMISRYRPSRPIIVFTPHEETARQLSLSFACHPFIAKSFKELLHVVTESEQRLVKEGLAKRGDTVVLAAGIPFGKVGGTNTMMVQTL
ncbi:MAG TPA: pyruvate kinase [Candidatus Paceibacterota bacterium]|nr:pyruvate kinase [Candidatus Paceibacterota bacterium]